VEIWQEVRMNKMPGCEPGEMFEEGGSHEDLWLSRPTTICRGEKGKKHKQESHRGTDIQNNTHGVR
jgi:hypothetical protein